MHRVHHNPQHGQHSTQVLLSSNTALLLQSVDNPPGFNNNSAHDVPVRLRGGGQPKKLKQEGNQRQGSSFKKAAKGNAAAAASPATQAEPPAEMKDDSPHQQAGSSMQTPFEYHVGDHIEVIACAPLLRKVLCVQV